MHVFPKIKRAYCWQGLRGQRGFGCTSGGRHVRGKARKFYVNPILPVVTTHDGSISAQEPVVHRIDQLDRSTVESAQLDRCYNTLVRISIFQLEIVCLVHRSSTESCKPRHAVHIMSTAVATTFGILQEHGTRSRRI